MIVSVLCMIVSLLIDVVVNYELHLIPFKQANCRYTLGLRLPTISLLGCSFSWFFSKKIRFFANLF